MQKRINMKNISFLLSLIFLIFTFYSCNKDKDGPFIKAGSHPIPSYYDYFDLGTVRNLDLDRDGNIDVKLVGGVILGNNGFTGGVSLRIMDTTLFEICSFGLDPTAYCFNEKDIINGSLEWKNNKVHHLIYHSVSYIFPYSSISIDDWKSRTGFVGVRKKMADNEYKYGWIKLRVNDIDDVGYVLGYCLLK